MSSTDKTHSTASSYWSDDQLRYGIVDLYANRMSAVATQIETTRQEAYEHMVVTQPFGRAFTAQPSFPPDLPEANPGLSGLRKKLAGSAPGPRRKFATS